MDKNDFFCLEEPDLTYISGLENSRIRFKGDYDIKPLVFLDLQRDHVTGQLTQIGAFFPEGSFSNRQILKNRSYVRSSRNSWSSLFIPVRSNNTSGEYLELKTDRLEAVQYFKHGECMLRCLEEGEAMTQLIQFLAPIKYCLEKVTLVTWCEADIKFLLRKVSEFSLTQLFMSATADFLTLLSLISLPVAPTSLDQLIHHREVDLKCLLSNSAQRSRALAHAFTSTGEQFVTYIQRKDFSVLEEFFFMNFDIKLDENNEDNINLYVGDLHLKVKDNDLRDIIRAEVGIPTSEYTVKMCNHPKTRVFLGYAYLQFRTHDQALKTLSRLNNEMLMGKPMRVVWHNKDVATDKGNSNLFIKNLPFEIDQKELNDTFRVFGKILSSKISLDPSGGSKGFGFVQFDTEHDALRAIEFMHGLNRGDKELFVSIKLSDEERRRRCGEMSENSGTAVIVSIAGETGLDVESVFQKMQQTGNIIFIKSNKMTPSAVVFVYASPTGARGALAFDSSHFLGNRLEVDYFQDWMADEEETVKGITLFVGNLDPSMTSSDLKRTFTEVPYSGTKPPVMRAKVATNSIGASLLYGHVTMRPEVVHLAQIKFNGKIVNGKKLNVHINDDEDDDNKATTSKTKTLPPVKPVPKAPLAKLDSKSMLTNRIQNAMRKKLKVQEPSTSSPSVIDQGPGMVGFPSITGSFFSGSSANQTTGFSGASNQNAGFSGVANQNAGFPRTANQNTAYPVQPNQMFLFPSANEISDVMSGANRNQGYISDVQSQAYQRPGRDYDFRSQANQIESSLYHQPSWGRPTHAPPPPGWGQPPPPPVVAAQVEPQSYQPAKTTGYQMVYSPPTSPVPTLSPLLQFSPPPSPPLQARGDYPTVPAARVNRPPEGVTRQIVLSSAKVRSIETASSRKRSTSRGRRSNSRERRSFSRGRRSRSRGRRSRSRGRRSRSRGRSTSRGMKSRSRSIGRRSRSRNRKSGSRSTKRRSRSKSKTRRGSDDRRRSRSKSRSRRRRRSSSRTKSQRSRSRERTSRRDKSPDLRQKIAEIKANKR